ncbi:DUF2807 domain-containing protein [Parabacteroides sp. OttesenSCG-928-N08]|nr:DUF2807 domain-containing protein [Parabacteroides sp. OttesenSCG-928-N08]
MKTKMRILLMLLLIGSFTLSAAEKEKGNGTLKSRSFTVEQFETIEISSRITLDEQSGLKMLSKKRRPKFDFYYTQTVEQSTVEVTIDENLLHWIVAEVKEGKLLITTKYDDLEVVPTQITCRGASPLLKRVDINGYMNFTANNLLHADSIAFYINGVSDVKLEDIRADYLRCHLSGVGNVYLKGKVGKGRWDISGVGKYFAYDCPVEELECRLSGVGKMQVNATERLIAEVSGVGSIRYTGAASIHASTSGIGRVKRK